MSKVKEKLIKWAEKINSIGFGLQLGLFKVSRLYKVSDWCYRKLYVILNVVLIIWLLGLTGIAPVLYNIGVVMKVFALLVLSVVVCYFEVNKAYNAYISSNEIEDVKEEDDESKTS